MFISELLDFRWCGNNTCWNIVAQNWGTTFHFDYVPPALVQLKYYFANCVFSPRLCWDRKAGLSIWWVCSIPFPSHCGPIDRYFNLTVRARIKLFVLASVFIATVPLGKGVFTQSLFICCSGIVVIRHGKPAVIKSGVL